MNSEHLYMRNSSTIQNHFVALTPSANGFCLLFALVLFPRKQSDSSTAFEFFMLVKKHSNSIHTLFILNTAYAGAAARVLPLTKMHCFCFYIKSKNKNRRQCVSIITATYIGISNVLEHFQYIFIKLNRPSQLPIPNAMNDAQFAIIPQLHFVVLF